MNDYQRIAELKQQALAMFDYLNQGEQWKPKDRDRVRIADMDEGWRRNAAAFLLRRSDWAHLYSWGMVLAPSAGPLAPTPGSHAADALDDEIALTTARIFEDPARFLAATPLYRALVDGLPDAPEGGVRHLSECALRDESLAHLGCTCHDDSPEWTL